MSKLHSADGYGVDARFLRAGGHLEDKVAVTRVVGFDLQESAFTAAATDETIVLGGLKAGELVWSVYLDLVTEFAGGSISAATLEVGRAGDPNGYLLATNVFTGAGTGYKRPANTGIGADLFLLDGTVEVPLWPHVVMADENLVCILRTTTANVNALTAGRVKIYVVCGPNLTMATLTPKK